MAKQLYRSKHNRLVSGVCGGIAEYLDMDPTLIRLVWVIITMMGGIGFIAYLVSVVIIPENPYGSHVHGVEKTPENDVTATEYHAHRPEGISRKNRILAGVFFIGLGIIFFMEQYFYWMDFEKLWPLLLIVLGVYIIYRGKGENKIEK